jgi:hypothetical protein
LVRGTGENLPRGYWKDETGIDQQVVQLPDCQIMIGSGGGCVDEKWALSLQFKA